MPVKRTRTINLCSEKHGGGIEYNEWNDKGDSNKIWIYVHFRTGKCIPFKCDRNDTVTRLKERISIEEGVTKANKQNKVHVKSDKEKKEDTDAKKKEKEAEEAANKKGKEKKKK